MPLTHSARWKSVFWRWLPLLLWLVGIYIMSDQPSGSIPGFGIWDWIVKKGAHLTAYAILYVLMVRAVRQPWLALALTVLYAMSDEYHQTFVIGRNGNWIDVGIDTLGALLAHVAIARIDSFRNRPRIG